MAGAAGGCIGSMGRLAWIGGLAGCVTPGDPITLPVAASSSQTAGGDATSAVPDPTADGSESGSTGSIASTDGPEDASTGGSDAGTGGEPPRPDEAPIGWAAVADEGGPVVGGAGGPVVLVDDEATFEALAGTDDPVTLRIVGTLEGMLSIAGSNKTIEGTPGSVIRGGLQIHGEVDAPIRNLILRDLTVVGTNCEPECSDTDGISLRYVRHVWVHHCDISDADDGNLDITRESDFVTVSWTKFSYSDPARSSRYSTLVGGDDSHTGDAGRLRVTFHHDWWTSNVAEQMPWARYGLVHLFNNYYTAVDNDWCVRAGIDSNVIVEGNVFDGSTRPVDLPPDETAAVRIEGNLASPEPLADLVQGEPFVPPYLYTLDPVGDVARSVAERAGPREH